VGNDLFETVYYVIMACLLLAVGVSVMWPFGRVPEDQFGVEIVGSKHSTTVVEQGQKGIQPRLLSARTRYFRWRRNVTFHDMVVVRDGCMGVVTAHVGIESQDKVAKYNPLFGHFDVVEAFLAHGGQQGVQAFLLPPGTYAIHPNAFTVVQCDQVVIPEETLGVITAHIGVESTDGTTHYDHRFGAFTDVSAFLGAGGRQGVQEPLLRPGTYAIHPNAFEVVVISTDSEEDHDVFGDLSDATSLLDTHTVTSVQTERGTALVVELENPSLAAQAVGQGCTELSVERILLLVIRPTRDVAIEWEVAVGVDLIDPEKTVIEILNSLVREAFGYGNWSLMEFVSKLAQVDEKMRSLYRARVNEAVMLPTATVWTTNN
jgi:hypothetical protein